MVAPLEGVRVVEVSNWLAVPAAAALMADMGADVVKVEPPAGDIFRHFVLRSIVPAHEFATNYAFQLDNRGKRSVVVDLDQPGGPELVRELAATADIFMTNLVQHRRERYGLTWEVIKSVNPRAVYVSFSGYGTRGPDAGRAGFDFAAFWARSGIMSLIAEPDAPPPLCRGGQGDHSTALNILAATLAGLRVRDRTGEAQHVELTLQGTGMWTIAGDYAAGLVARAQPPRISRTAPVNPIWNSYRCSDDRWVLLVNPVPFPDYWPRFCRAVDRPQWITDERSCDFAALRANSAAITAEIDAIFAEHDLRHWTKRLDAEGIIWAPVATVPEVIDDPQVREMGWIEPVEHPVYGRFETLGVPFKVYGADIAVRGPAPDVGQHTFEVLEELGVDADRLAQLAADGVIG